jgi:hypothetical protein
METILSMLARASSDNEHEAAQALASAIKRMEKEGITIFDILDQPNERLYQSVLMRLAEAIVKQQYPQDRIKQRDILEKLYLAIALKFNAEFTKTNTGQGSQGKKQNANSNNAGQDRADQAQAAYEQAQAEKNAKAEADRKAKADNQGAGKKKGSEQRRWAYHNEQDTEPQKVALWETLKSHPVSKFIIPHPYYLANQLWEDIAHQIKSIFIVFLASIAVGYIFGFLVSGYFIYHGYLKTANVVYFIGMYIGATSAFNFHLWKHRNYRWS